MTQANYSPENISDDEERRGFRQKARNNFNYIQLALNAFQSWVGQALDEIKATIIKPALRGGFAVNDIRYYGTLGNAIASIPSASPHTIYITNEQAINANLTVPSNISIDVLTGGSFAIGGGVTLTLNGPFIAPDNQIVRTGSGTLALGIATARRSVKWYGATGDGSTSDSTAIQMACTDLRDGCSLLCPKPSVFYNLTSSIEVADKQAVTIDFCPANILNGSTYITYAFKYTGANLTGYENAVLRIVGCSYSKFYGAAIDQNNKAEYAFWVSGLNTYLGSATLTSNRLISTGCEISHFANCNQVSNSVSKKGMRLGCDDGNSSQTDNFVAYACHLRAIETGSSLAVDASPITRGCEIHGANTYAKFIHCSASGDTAWFQNAGSVSYDKCYAVGSAREGWYFNDQRSPALLSDCYSEGLSGRGIRIASGDSVSSRTILIDGGTFLHTTKPAKTFDAATDINTTTDIFSISAHGYSTDDMLIVSLNGATFPVTATTINDGETLYAIRSGAGTLQLSRTLGGAAINFTAAGSGTVTLTWQAAPWRLEGNMSVQMNACFGQGWISSPTGFTNEPPVYVDFGHWNVPPDFSGNPDIQVISLSAFGGANKETVRRYFHNLFQQVVDDSGGTNTGSRGASFANYIVVNSGSGNSWTPPPAKKGMVFNVAKLGSGTLTVNAPTAKTFDGAANFDPTTDTFTIVGHALLQGTAVIVDLNGGTFPVAASVITTGNTLHTIYVDTNNVKFARTAALAAKGTAIDFSADGSGTIKLYTGQIQRHDSGAAATTSVAASRGGERGVIEFRCLQDGKWNVSSTMKLTYDGGSEYLAYSGVWDPANLAADGDVTATNVTVTDAVVGDYVQVSHDQLVGNNVLLWAHVSAADTVRVMLMNKTGGAINIASGTLKVRVTKA
jgi:hypothetical protein